MTLRLEQDFRSDSIQGKVTMQNVDRNQQASQLFAKLQSTSRRCVASLLAIFARGLGCFGMFVCLVNSVAANGLGESPAATSYPAHWTPLAAQEPESGRAPIEIPRAIDDRLQVDLFVQEPALRTPTGLTVLPDGDVLVIESHSHFRPEDYDGPPADRIRRFRDSDGDGVADIATTFFQGTTATMAIAVHPSGVVFLATRNEVYRLQDLDKDGVAEGVTIIAKLETPGTYPHNGLSGFAFDMQDQIYFGFGENLGEPYTLTGFDGVKLSGGGEGGSIFRCDLNGKSLVRFATGFWNPFHLAFDDYGRLFAVDNDPDWRPPCRLLQIVEGGDYGYRFELGRRGTHPFSSWFGEVPGTLGMVSGTGEAPSGLIVYQSDALPSDYNGAILSTSWGMHSIERFDLERQGATFRSQAQTIIKGDVDFRPVAIALAPDGSLYVSDWVKRSYELHGHGRIWRIRPNQADPRIAHRTLAEQFTALHRPTSQAAALRLANDPDSRKSFQLNALAEFQPNPRLRSTCIQALIFGGFLRAEEAALLLAAEKNVDVQELIATQAPLEAKLIKLLLETPELKLELPVVAALLRRCESPELAEIAWKWTESKDPFVQQAARLAIERSLKAKELAESPLPESEAQRIALALLLMNSNEETAKSRISDLLSDESSVVRFIALRWIGEQKKREFESILNEQIKSDPEIERLFDAYMATIDLINPERSGAQFESSQIGMLSEMLEELDYAKQPELTELVIRRLTSAVMRDQLEELPQTLQVDALTNFIRAGSMEATDVLYLLINPRFRSAREQLLTEKLQPQVMALLLSQVWQQSSTEKTRLMRFALDPKTTRWGARDANDAELKAEDYEMIQRTALRTLVGFELSEREASQLDELAQTSPDLAESVQRVIWPDSLSENRPPVDDVTGWLAWLTDTARGEPDVTEGKRIFFSPRLTQCSTCHQIDGRGGNIGPDLSHAKQLGMNRIAESVLQPSREVAPKYEAWTIISLAGEVRTGVLVTERGSTQIYADSLGGLFQIDFNDIEVRQPSTTSIMPEHLLDRLTDKEITDLFGYLMSLE